MKTKMKQFADQEAQTSLRKVHPSEMIECDGCGETEESHPLILIECMVCGNAAYSPVDYAEGEALLSSGLITRRCSACGGTTLWKQFDTVPGALVQAEGHGEQPAWLIVGRGCN